MYRLIRSLLYDFRINAAVMLGVMCAAAVLTGALLTGDSMRYSLKALTLKRLGTIDTILFAPDFIDENFKPSSSAVPAIYLSGAAEYNGKVSSTQILAMPIDGTAYSLFDYNVNHRFIVNHILADKLQLQNGSELSLRFLSPQSIPPESTFGKHDNLIRTKITIDTVLDCCSGIGHFSLKADQQGEPLLIVPLEFLQEKLDIRKKINTVLYLSSKREYVDRPLPAAVRNKLIKDFQPTLDDLGISVSTENGVHYYTSKRMLFSQPQVEAFQRAGCAVDNFADPALIYLATSIKATKNGKEIPYSTVLTTDGLYFSMGFDEDMILLNEWAAEDLDAEEGNEIELTWFEPDNVNVTKSKKFTVAAVIPNERYPKELVPSVKGFTDENSITDWDPPFPFDAKKIRKKDEDYWDKYRAAPKAVVSLATGQKLWGSRFGNVSVFVTKTDPETLRQKLLANTPLSVFNLNFVPVKEQGLAASLGSTPFSVLFIGFSFFIIASALMLVMLLFRLSVEMKAKQIGIRIACGWTHRQILKLLLAQAFVISVTGSFLGVLFGIVYANLMIYALTTFWLDAVSVPFLQLSINPVSLLIGFLGGTLSAMFVIILTLHSTKRIPVKTLLGGGFTPLSFFKRRISRIKKENTLSVSSAESAVKKTKRAIKFICLLTVTWLMFACVQYQLYSDNYVFFIGSASWLFFCICVFFQFLSEKPAGNLQFRSLAGLSKTNIVRNRLRSVLCVGLVASTVFLVLSISAFRLDPNAETKYRYGGNGSGGFDSIAETAFPVGYDVNTPEGRAELGLQEKEEQIYAARQMDVVPVRSTGGDNAGCLNLYQTSNPHILGVPCERLTQRKHKGFGNFRFAAPNRKYHESTPWSDLHNLSVSVDPDGVKRVPVILDQNTAMYSFHLYKGIGEVYELSYNNETLRCEVIGLLSNSVLQGGIIMSETNFKTLFPDISGYRLFLIGKTVPAVQLPEWYAMFNKMLEDYGVQTETATNLLRRQFAVQNTYLSAFQSLGGIGLLLGVFGLAVIQVRNVFERRKELALFQALGFRQSRVILLLLYENFTLLFWGLLLAVFASLFALLPFLFGSSQDLSFGAVLRQFIYLTGGMFLIGIVSNIAASLSVLKIPVARELAEER